MKKNLKALFLAIAIAIVPFVSVNSVAPLPHSAPETIINQAQRFSYLHRQFAPVEGRALDIQGLRNWKISVLNFMRNVRDNHGDDAVILFFIHLYEGINGRNFSDLHIRNIEMTFMPYEGIAGTIRVILRTLGGPTYMLFL